MHGAAVDFDAFGQRALVGFQPREHRQQRGMDIQQAAFETRDEGRAEDAHVAGQHHQIGLVALDFIGQQRIEGFTVGVFGVVERDGGQAVLARIRPAPPPAAGC